MEKLKFSSTLLEWIYQGYVTSSGDRNDDEICEITFPTITAVLFTSFFINFVSVSTICDLGIYTDSTPNVVLNER